MIKNVICLELLLLLAQPMLSQSISDAELKPRVVILTDISSWEPDDNESLVRLLTHADLVEIEALIYTTGWSLDETQDDFFQLIHDGIDAYEKDLPNLMKRSEQSEFYDNEEKQKIGYWPSPGYLRQKTMFGSQKRGMSYIGEDNVSDGSNKIIELADEDDSRPLWILVWGGANTLAQSVWQVQQKRSPEELKTFLNKVPTYAITDQDRSYIEGTPFESSSQQWLREEFSEDLLYFWDECAWKFQNANGKENWEKYEENIQGHGHLGEIYPKYKFGMEGDTPSFLHVLPIGLNDPMIPGHIGWGCYFEWSKGPDDKTYAYTNAEGKAKDICSTYEEYFYSATFNNFVARMDWVKEGTGNRNPEVVLNGESSSKPLEVEGEAGKTIKLDASETTDPDSDQLNFKWWVMTEAGTYEKEIPLAKNKKSNIRFKIPSDSARKTIHIICEVYDDGSPSLTSYQRLIINSK